jgi:hypothetical protein
MSMRVIVRWGLLAVVTVHGLIHLLGAAKGLGWVEVAQLNTPISTWMGVAWLAAGLLVLAAGALLALKARPWWVVAATAGVVSQTTIITAWTDAAAGSVANVLLLAAAAYGYASQGPGSFRSKYRRRVAASLAALEPTRGGTVTEADLASLPEPVAAYVRRCGAVGRPRVTSFRARMHGRIRQGADRPWMRFTAEQVNTYGPDPSRVFFMDATMFGLPVDVLHTFVGPAASMRAKVCSLVRVVDAAGPDMARAETVTLLNDLCLFAPAALVDAPITWHTLDHQRVRATYANGPHIVTAELVFNDQAELVDFISEDRMAATPDGKGFTTQRWSTPLREYGPIGPYRLATAGEGRWHPDGKPPFTYIELHLDDITYNPGIAADILDASGRVPQTVG